MTDSTEDWYIIQVDGGHCEVLPSTKISQKQQFQADHQVWGPYASEEEAIARRVGLIRSGKCKPV